MCIKRKRIISLTLAALLVLGLGVPKFSAEASTKAETATDILFDDFDKNVLDTDKWLIAHKKWGGDNGGVVKENVSVSDGTLKLEGHGLKYKGDVQGIGRKDGTLTGAAIASRDYFSSGSYEVVAKIAPNIGACSAFWTFEYEEYYPGEDGYDPKYATYGYCTVNHEIDIEIPTGTDKYPDPNFNSARFNTYVRENDYTPHYHDLGFALNDGKFHTYRFDWHTGDANETPRVEFYIDNNRLYTSYTDIPTNASRFWLAVWFPYAQDSDKDGKADTGWAGLADFDTTLMEIDSVKITPFHEANDTEQHETYAYDGWAPNSFPELAHSEDYEHILNGDFSKGSESWTLKDEADIKNGKAVLSSGQVADSIYQLVDVNPGASYVLTADVTTDGTEVMLGASKPNGSNDQYTTVTESGKVSFSFNNETVNPILKVYAKVDRWQGSNVNVTIDNISLKGTAYVEGTKVTFLPAESEEPKPEESLTHTHSYGAWQSDNSQHWKECSCKEKTSLFTHTFDGGQITKEPTAKENGVRTFTCTICKYQKNEVIPKKTDADEKDPPNFPVSPVPTSTPVPSEYHKISETFEPCATPCPTETPVSSPRPSNKPDFSESPKPSESPRSIQSPGPWESPKPSEEKKASELSDNPQAPEFMSESEFTAVSVGSTIIDDKSGDAGIVINVSKREVSFSKVGNQKVKSVTVPSYITYKGVKYKVVEINDRAFKNNKKLQKVVLPYSLRVIGKEAFYGCEKLKSVTIRTNVTAIKDRAFGKCGALTAITLPSKVSVIGTKAFYGCGKLKKIKVVSTKITKKHVGVAAFKGINPSAVVDVPKAKLKTYKKLFKAKGLNGRKQLIK